MKWSINRYYLYTARDIAIYVVISILLLLLSQTKIFGLGNLIGFAAVLILMAGIAKSIIILDLIIKLRARGIRGDSLVMALEASPIGKWDRGILRSFFTLLSNLIHSLFFWSVVSLYIVYLIGQKYLDIGSALFVLLGVWACVRYIKTCKTNGEKFWDNYYFLSYMMLLVTFLLPIISSALVALLTLVIPISNSVGQVMNVIATAFGTLTLIVFIAAVIKTIWTRTRP